MESEFLEVRWGSITDLTEVEFSFKSHVNLLILNL